VWRVVLRNHQQHALRLALVCLAIAVGVAFLAATFVLTDTDRAAIASSADQAYANVAVAVQGPFSSSRLPGLAGHILLPEDVLTTVRRVSGVSQAQGEVDGYAQLVGSNGVLIGGNTSLARGISVGPVPSLRPFVLGAGRLPSTSREVVVDAQTFAAQGWHLGQSVRIVSDLPIRAFTIVGVVRSRQTADVLGATLLGFTVPEAQQLLGSEGHFSVVLCASHRGLPEDVLASRVASAIGPGYEVLTGSSFARESADFSSAGVPTFSAVLDAVFGVIMLVGALVIFNIISILVVQRRRELALLRCVGAWRSQIYRSVLGEMAVIGVLASAAGLGLGIAAAAVLRNVSNGSGAQTSAAGLDISPRTVLVSLLVGTATTILASLLPAIQASRVPPVSALRQDVIGEVAASSRRWRVTGLVVGGLGVALVAAGLLAEQGRAAEIWLVGGGMALGLFGLGRLSPLVVPPLIALVGWPLPRLVGAPGLLGRKNAMHNPRRTAATAGALVIGVALVSLLAIIASSAKASSNSQLDQSLSAGFEVVHTGTSPLTDGPSGSQALSPRVLQRLQAQPGLTVSPFEFVTFLLDGHGGYGAAVDPSTISKMISFGTLQGSVTALSHGGFAVSVQQAAPLHLTVGEHVDVALVDELPSRGSTEMQVDAIYAQGDHESGFLFSTATVSELDPSLALSAVLIRAKPGVSSREAEAAVASATKGFPDASVLNVAAVRTSEDQRIASQINLITLLLALAIIVAVLGIVNTMALSVVERTRELAVLRAVGMSRSQIVGMVQGEAAVIGAVGAACGVVLGLFLGWAFQRALSSQGLTDLMVPWTRLVVYVVAGAATGLVAGSLPARRAARVDMLAAIASE